MTNAELAVLSLIVEQPRHGYEIERVIEERGMRQWTEIGFSSIYYLLKKLQSEGLVESALVQAERGPARKVYRATAAGRASHQQAVLQALSLPHCPYPPLQLGLANLPALPTAKARSALQRYAAALQDRLAELQARRQSQQPLAAFVAAMFDYSETMIRAEAQWVLRFQNQLDDLMHHRTREEPTPQHNAEKKEFPDGQD